MKNPKSILSKPPQLLGRSTPTQSSQDPTSEPKMGFAEKLQKKVAASKQCRLKEQRSRRRSSNRNRLQRRRSTLTWVPNGDEISSIEEIARVALAAAKAETSNIDDGDKELVRAAMAVCSTRGPSIHLDDLNRRRFSR